MRRLVLPIAPKPKPRMTAADRWKRRPVVLDYWTWCEDVRALWTALRFPPFPEAGAAIHFRVPMPASWSKRKRAAMAGEPHRQTPDLDNMLKALLDALHIEDKAIWHLSGLSKRWTAGDGSIVILLDSDDAARADVGLEIERWEESYGWLPVRNWNAREWFWLGLRAGGGK